MSGGQPTPTRFGELLRRWRRAAGLTQEALAERAGMSLRGVSDLERGVNRTARRETVQMLADALQLGSQDRAAFEAAARASVFAPAPLPAHHAPWRAISAVPRLVGRRQEVARIERHLAAASDVQPPVLLFAGEPGIGKSHLLHEAAERAAAAGWRVLAGGCTRRSGQEPYAPFVDIFARSIAQLSAAEKRRELQGCAWLVRLLPELLESAVMPAPSWTLPPDQEQRLIFAAVARYLANIAGPSGTLLVLDDLQWAGADALDLLDRLVRTAAEATGPGTPESPAGPRLRMVGAYRSTEVNPQHPLGILQTDLARTGVAARYALGPLALAEASALAADLLVETGAGETERATLVERVTSRAGGVPFYLVNCTQAARAGAFEEGTDEGKAQIASTDTRATGRATTEEVPWAVAETIRQRIAALPERARELLGVAAVIGRVVPYALLKAATATAAPQSEGELLPALDAACRAHLLEERAEAQELAGGTAQYQFAHDLIHEVIFQDLGAARRVRLHRAVAIALEQLSEAKGKHERRAAELAYHLLEAEEPARALPYALMAGDHAEAMYAHAEAERHYRMAIELAGEVGDTAREAEALEKLAAIMQMLARRDEALELYERALQQYHAVGDREGERRTVSRALDSWGLEGLPRVLPLLSSTEADSGGDPTPGVAALYTSLAHIYCAYDRYAEGLAAAERAEQFARALHDDALLVQALYWRIGAAEGFCEDVLRQWIEHIALAEWVGDLWILTFTLNRVACRYREDHADLVRATPYLERALAVAERRGGPAVVLATLANWIEHHFVGGDWTAARACAERGGALMREVERGGIPWGWYLLLLALGTLDLAQGRTRDGEQRLEQAAAFDDAGSALVLQRGRQRALAERDLVAGHAAAASARLAPLLDRPGMQERQVTPLLPLLAWAQFALDRDEQAAVTLAACHARCGRLWLVDALRVRAMLAMKQQQWQEAAASLDESLEICRTMPYPHAEAKALYVYGQLHAAKGEPDLARECYEQAIAICHRLGEGIYRPHIEHALADLAD